MFKSILWLILVVPFLFVFKLVLVILGLPMVAIGLIKPEVIENPEPYDGRTTDMPWQMVELRPKWINNLWGSDKYGAQGNWFWNDDQDTTKFWPRFNWLALRNPVSNLQNVFPMYKLENVRGSETEYIGDRIIYDNAHIPGWQYAWYGKYGGFRCVFNVLSKSVHIRLGYKLEPSREMGSASLSFMVGLE